LIHVGIIAEGEIALRGRGDERNVVGWDDAGDRELAVVTRERLLLTRTPGAGRR
jgi:hypothetical protein